MLYLSLDEDRVSDEQTKMIVGLAPCFLKERIPFDKTMLYYLLQMIGIDKEEALQMFYMEYCYPDSCYNEYQIIDVLNTKRFLRHFEDNIVDKLSRCNKVIVIGQLPQQYFLLNQQIAKHFRRVEWLALPDLNERYSNFIQDHSKILSKAIKQFLF